MLINEVWPDETLILTDGKWLNRAAGALATAVAGMGAVGAMHTSDTSQTTTAPTSAISPIGAPSGTPSTTPATSAIEKPATTPTAQQARVVQGGNPHPNFPSELRDVSPGEKVTSFIRHILPEINKANQEILDNRRILSRIVTRGHTPTPGETAWMNTQFSRYDTTDINVLWSRMDAVPPMLALAQAGLESNWGQDDLARQGNVFFGQKAGRNPSAIVGTDGQRYHMHASPLASIRSYIHNLNTGTHYESFRKERHALRNQDIDQITRAERLIPSLASSGYSQVAGASGPTASPNPNYQDALLRTLKGLEHTGRNRTALASVGQDLTRHAPRVAQPAARAAPMRMAANVPPARRR
jgi:hypothetical protein